MILVYVGKGMQDEPEPITYIFETDLSKEELIAYLNNKAQEYKHGDFKNESAGEEFFHEFIVEIGGCEYGFCLGDHMEFPDKGFKVYTIDEFLQKKIDFRHEDMI